MPPSLAKSTDQALPPAGFLLLAGLSLFWGLNWPGMKIIMAELPAWWFRAACALVGGFALLTLSSLSGNAIGLGRREVVQTAICSLFNFVGWLMFSAYGVSLVEAGRAAIIAFTMPVWAAIFASLLLGERFTLSKIVGLLLGITGLGVLIGPDLVAVGRSPVGGLLMLGAALSWAFGTTLFKRFEWNVPVAANVGWQLLFASVPILIIAVALEPFPDIGAISYEATLALIYIFGFPMIFCQWAYYKTVHLFPASIAAIGTLMVPVVGVYSSHFLLAEPVGLRELSALVLIVAALASVLLIPNLKKLGR